MTKKKTWIEKLHDSKDLPKVVKLKKESVEHWHGENMVVPSPLEVNNIMRKVPKGKLITINELRQALAKKFKTDIACPLTSGIFSWIAAHAAEEERVIGKKDITPYWRTLKSGGKLNPKYPGGIDQQKTFLEDEGHKVIQKCKKYVIEDYKEKLAKI
jgi:hypothetical protein